MKRMYWLLRIESFLILIIYPFVALASMMSLAASGAPSLTAISDFDRFLMNSFLWLTLLYPVSVILTEILNWGVRKKELWARALTIQTFPVFFQIVCVLLAVYCISI